MSSRAEACTWILHISSASIGSGLPGVDKLYGACWSHLCPKELFYFTNLGQGLSQKVGFFLTFEPIFELAFPAKGWLVRTRNPPLSLLLAFLAIVFSQFTQILYENSLGYSKQHVKLCPLILTKLANSGGYLY